MELRVFVGRIYTSFSPLRSVEALAVLGESVVYAGSLRDVEKTLCRTLPCSFVDLRGVAVPGFIDAHLHLDGVGFSELSIDLRGCRSIDEMKRRIGECAKSFGGRWVYGRGWDQELLGRWPTRWDLDEVCGDRLCLAIRVCGHAGVVNSRVLEELGLVERFGSSPNLVRDERGVPTGVVLEEVLEFVRDELGRDFREVRRWVEAGVRECVEHGVTGCAWMSVSLPALATLAELYKRCATPSRVSVYLEPRALEVLKPVSRICVSSRACIVGVKMFLDGSLGARTAWLSSPYSDDPTTVGRPSTSLDEAAKLCSRARNAGLDVAIHAIGDRAIDWALELARRFGARIEHASVVRDDQLPRFENVRVSIQPHFVVTDWWVDRRLGEERMRWVYRFAELAKIAQLGISTDAPVEPINPLETIYAACCASPPGKRLSVVDALRLYTEGSAKISHLSRCGKLEPGFFADIAVLDRDPLEVDCEELRRAKIVETYIGGERVRS